MKKKKISYILSFKNEQDNLRTLIQEIFKVFKKFNNKYLFELIFINDQSSDSSISIIKEQNYNNNHFEIFIYNTKYLLGNSRCIFLGMSVASGDAIIYLDSDLQDPPRLSYDLINEWEKGFEIVATKRIKRQKEPLLKKLISFIGYRILKFICNIEPDAGEYKLYDRKIVNYIKDLKVYDPFLRGISSEKFHKKSYISYEREARLYGKSHYPLFKSLNPYNEFARGFFYDIKKFQGISIISSFFISVIFFLYILFNFHLFGFILFIAFEIIIILLLFMVNLIINFTYNSKINKEDEIYKI